MIDPRTTNIVGVKVKIIKRWNSAVCGRGVVRVVDYNHGAFNFLVESTDYTNDFGASKGGLFQVSTLDESLEVVVDE